MTRPGSAGSLSEAILEQASSWFIDFNEGMLDSAGREALYQWLRRSPEHVRAYIEIAAAWEDSSQLKSRGAVAIEALIAQARAEDNLIELMPGSGAPAPQRDGRKSAAGRMRFAALAASVALAAAGIWVYSQRNIYATATGEQRSITLTDGSTVMLNSRSRLEVRFTGQERAVELLEGQALFQVRKNTARPFIVSSHGMRVRAVGTQFDVYRRTTDTTVTVIEGRVAVAPPSPASAPPAGQVEGMPVQEGGQGLQAGNGKLRKHGALKDERGPSREVLLVAGEQLTVSPPGASRPVRVDVAQVMAWTQRRLIFNETLLADAVAEFNRYNTRQIVVEDPTLAAFHIRGSFQATDPDRLVEFLRDRFGVRVTEREGEIRIAGH